MKTLRGSPPPPAPPLAAAAATSAASQAWRQSAAGVGTTARVLIIGTHPEDEDNALIAWLSLGRHVETAYLSLTRGEAAANVAGNERQSALGVVRTAELLAERRRDGAHQYFTRAYDFGATKLDSILDRVWPHDSLVHDVVSVVRAFRPHVIISLYSADSTDRTRRTASPRASRAKRSPSRATPLACSRATSADAAWTVSRLLTRVDSATAVLPDWSPSTSANSIARRAARTRSSAPRFVGCSERSLRRLHRSSVTSQRFFRSRRARTEGHEGELFADVDTTLARVSACPRGAGIVRRPALALTPFTRKPRRATPCRSPNARPS